MLLSFFVSPLSHQQNISLFSSRGNKVTWGQDQVNRESGAQGHAIFGKKLQYTQRSVGRCTCKSPIMKWANVLKESSKKFTEASHNNDIWYTDTDGTLEHLPSRGSLYCKGPPKLELSSGGISSHICTYYVCVYVLYIHTHIPYIKNIYAHIYSTCVHIIYIYLICMRV